MIMKWKKSQQSPSSRPVRAGKLSLLALVVAAFLLGYSSMVYLRNNECRAAFIPSPPTIVIATGDCSTTYPTPMDGCVGLCDPIGSSATIKTTDETVIDTLLENLTDTLPPWLARVTTGANSFTLTPTGGGDDGFIGGEIDVMMQSLLLRLNDTELDMIDWWDTMWWYNLRPAMQAMTRQLNTATSQQAEDFQSGMDAFQEDETNLEDMHTDNKNHQAVRVSENACVAATASGGFGRVTNYARAMRQALQDDMAATAQNRVHQSGTSGATRPSAAGMAAKLKQDAQVFESTFCNPQDNGGHNAQGCAAPNDKYGNSYADADVQVTKNLFNKLTMQVDDPADGANETKVAEAVLNNEMGDPTGDPIPANAMASPQGHELWLNRRSYLARYAAIRTVPQLIEGWRMPGSKLGPWIKEIEQDAGVPAGQGEMSDNPSYKEIVHAISIDRFNSGKYANQMIADDGEVEMEKLTISTFYLMQLRDYYELLEREALTLAVQVSLMAEKAPRPDAMEEQPIEH